MVQYSTDGAVAVVRLDRPPVNALSDQLAAELDEAFAMAEDPEVRAVVLMGEPNFAAGADIKEFQEAQESASDQPIAGTLRDAIRRLETLPKPSIAAIFGFALGGGLELAMGADMRYMASDARVGQPEIKLGLIPGAGGTQRLTRLVGLSKARDIVYTGRFVVADEALSIGLADKVVPADELFAIAMSDAVVLASGPTVALAAAKRALTEGWGRTIEEALEIEADAFNETFRSEDATEGVTAFVTKRETIFRGR
jgi:enoyl-CoA hydratase/carnithine racemase